MESATNDDTTPVINIDHINIKIYTEIHMVSFFSFSFLSSLFLNSSFFLQLKTAKKPTLKKCRV